MAITTRPARRAPAPGRTDAPAAGVRPAPAVIALSLIVAALATIAAATGLLSTGGDAPATVSSVHGEVVELDERGGVYRHDSVFKGGANRGADAVTLGLAVPVMLIALRGYRHGSLRGALVLSGALAWFLYVYASLALGTAYNALFLVYVALFGASLYALVLAVRSIDADTVGAQLHGRAPRRGLMIVLVVAALVTTSVWVVPLVAAAIVGDPPHLLGHSTTAVTEALDLAVIVPATLLAAWLLLRERPEGYVLALPLVLLLFAMLPMIAAQTAFQLAAGVTFTPPEVIGPLSGFLVLGAVALRLAVATLREADN
jgi:hypothetical protein